MENLSKADRKHIEAIHTFLQAETLIQTDEKKLGDVLQGMYDIIHNITEGTSTVYGHGIGASKKISALKNKLPGRDLVTFDLNLERLLKIHSQAYEILKLLVKDHEITKSEELQYSRSLSKSFEKYMQVIQTYTQIHAGIQLKDKAYKQEVESIVAYIDPCTSHEEKRDSILKKLSQTFMEIVVVYKELLKKNQEVILFYKELAKEYPVESDHNLNSDSAEIKPGDIITGIIDEMTDRGKNIYDQIANITVELRRIGDVIQLNDDIKKHLLEMAQQNSNA